ncbi:MAG: hypothetical protein G01um101448_580 [Parcubacteria group bacterium Gr01-1014_48]|nr:MAG: hypothetical protein Greene041614_670 [Parcubacteria group bacterium Greene0416_14]TSC73739.1 MAG: hypothetical protein G01um101448_580 [Parcubacteria group bacterium Gr01-1014_48]TSD01356.1 MAG: hypothetical protein Greene101415_291 [Parcubacteria group bacterium Greene1014_15]TSD07800.1 MAG: hypothetical protein Greene07144_707 [Parcubacteria group bacterium Greene0714_4]
MRNVLYSLFIKEGVDSFFAQNLLSVIEKSARREVPYLQ